MDGIKRRDARLFTVIMYSSGKNRMRVFFTGCIKPRDDAWVHIYIYNSQTIAPFPSTLRSLPPREGAERRQEYRRKRRSIRCRSRREDLRMWIAFLHLVSAVYILQTFISAVDRYSQKLGICLWFVANCRTNRDSMHRSIYKSSLGGTLAWSRCHRVYLCMKVRTAGRQEELTHVHVAEKRNKNEEKKKKKNSRVQLFICTKIKEIRKIHLEHSQYKPLNARSSDISVSSSSSSSSS